MSSLNKLIKYLGAGGAITLLVLTVLLIFVVGPFMLIWGLNLMGLEVAYSIKTFLGAGFVMLALKTSNTKGKESK